MDVLLDIHACQSESMKYLLYKVPFIELKLDIVAGEKVKVCDSTTSTIVSTY